MCQEHNTTKKRKCKQITEVQRYKIEGYLDAGISIPEIAHILGKAQSSIRREIKKGTIKLRDSQWREYNKYCADVAQRITEERRENKGPGLKIANDHQLAADIEKLIGKEKYSPDATIMKLAKNGKKYKTSICTKTLYNYIYSGLFLNIDKDDLTVKKKKKRKEEKRLKHKNRTGKSIEERPEIVETREEYGHQEMDLVVGKKGTKSALLVFTERKTLQEIIRKIRDKTQKSVKQAIDNLELEFGEEFSLRFKTVTSDNGSEFLDYESLEQSINGSIKRFDMYYAHPNSAFERGSNENANKLIRRFIPKGADIDDYSDEEIARIERWMNDYPRRKFNGKSANEMVA